MDLINTLKREFFLALVIGVLPQKYLGVLSKKLSTYQRTGRIHFIFPLGHLTNLISSENDKSSVSYIDFYTK